MSENPRFVEQGIYDGIVDSEYHADNYPGPALSCSIIKTLLSQSPIHAFYKHPALCETVEEEKKHTFDIGSATHALLLEGRNGIVECDYPDWKTKAAQQERDAARAEGLYPLLSKEWPLVAGMVESAQKILKASRLGINDLLAEGKPERSLVWEEDGLWMKARPDWMPNDNSFMLDIKTIGESANPDTIGKHIHNMSYQVQDVWYRRGWRFLKGTDVPFYFLFIEKKPPHCGCVVQLDPQFEVMGTEQVEYALNKWRNCLATDEWPGYTTEIVGAECPGYAMMAWSQKHMIEECAE